ncbi:DivIVA domain-containing protein [Microbacterium indicum]|uniref:DivIVA domain-containing protein n=1 Tax=Microbacterium indicum TaxID=358100 RepID=UPI000491BBF7|nr:DivIVA domain-containing protein [Microbacterium indicum]
MTDTRTAPAETPFVRLTGGKRGYDPEAVDAFLASARETFQSRSAEVTSADVRTASFPLVRGGYEIAVVDQALARLEDAFARRERDAAIDSAGASAWVDGARDDAQVLLARMSRPERQRFARVGPFSSGYSVAEVDAVAARIARYFATGDPITVDQVRRAAFRPQRGGYREEQVDAALDAVVQVILAVR